MSIDPFSEPVFPLAKAAKRIPHLRADRPVAPSTLWRWATVGLRGIKLETTTIGGTTCTSDNALRQFFSALSGNTKREGKPAEAEQRHVEEELDREGI